VPAIVAAVALMVSLSNHRAGVDPVVVSLRMTYEMRCGWPGPGLVVVFPAAEHLPATVPRSAVLVNGKPAAGVAHSGRQLSIAIPPPAGVQCDVIAPGTATVVFTRTAGLGNPRWPGTYSLSARHGTLVLRAAFAIRP
jgi:hypothetical protein